MCVFNSSQVMEPTRLLCPWDFTGKNTGVGCHFLLQGNLSKPGIELCLLWLLHRQADSLPLSHLGSIFMNEVHAKIEVTENEPL